MTKEKIIMWTMAALAACLVYLYMGFAIAMCIKFGKVPSDFIDGIIQVSLAILFAIGLFLIPHFAIELAKKFLK